MLKIWSLIKKKTLIGTLLLKEKKTTNKIKFYYQLSSKKLIFIITINDRPQNFEIICQSFSDDEIMTPKEKYNDYTRPHNAYTRPHSGLTIKR